jgi:hypothetical protein
MPTPSDTRTEGVPAEPQSPSVTPAPKPVPSATDSTTEPAPGSTEPAPEDTETNEPVSTAKVGDTVRVADWNVTVTKVTTKLSMETVKTWNPYNDKPTNGQYVMVDYTAVYRGNARLDDAFMALHWNFGGSDGVIYKVAYIVTQADNENWPTEARKGGKIRAQVVLDVPAKIAKGLVSVQGIASDMSEQFADFQL